jgi:hypothetical protein
MSDTVYLETQPGVAPHLEIYSGETVRLDLQSGALYFSPNEPPQFLPPPGSDGGSGGEAGEGVTDHGDLTGRGDDDHPQYLTQARGDARYLRPGSPGTVTQIIDFPVPSATWVVDVGRIVDVAVINSAGQEVWPGEVLYGPGTMITLKFSAPFSGKTYCFGAGQTEPP